MVIGVVGLWHLGCIISTSWAKLGNTVIGFDYDAKRVENLKAGDPPLYEPGLKESINTVLAAKTLCFTTNIGDLSQCDFVFLSYDTPVREDDSTDATILTDSVNDLKKILKNGSVLIVTHNRRRDFVESCVESLKKQTLHRYRVLARKSTTRRGASVLYETGQNNSRDGRSKDGNAMSRTVLPN